MTTFVKLINSQTSVNIPIVISTNFDRDLLGNHDVPRDDDEFIMDKDDYEYWLSIHETINANNEMVAEAQAIGIDISSAYDDLNTYDLEDNVNIFNSRLKELLA